MPPVSNAFPMTYAATVKQMPIQMQNPSNKPDDLFSIRTTQHIQWCCESIISV